MQDLGPATEDQVILAWLQADIESIEFQQYIVGDPPNPAYLTVALKAARSPNLSDHDQNALRRRIITKAHGFGQGTATFTGLDNDIRWKRMRLSAAEVAELYYANRGGAWAVLAPATRKVAEGATNVGHVFTGDATNLFVLSLASFICHSAKQVPEIITLVRPDGRLVILEGHIRATAIVLEAHRFPNGVEVFSGESPSVAAWQFL
ncbi:MAG: hypothetical protein ACHQ0J_07760 [Candidatus Dormibacterales bacterium]